jgi:hypothetical protein
VVDFCEHGNEPKDFIRGPFEKFVDRRHCAALKQREAVTCQFVVVGVT